MMFSRKKLGKLEKAVGEFLGNIIKVSILIQIIFRTYRPWLQGKLSFPYRHHIN